MQYFDRIATALNAQAVKVDAVLMITETAAFQFPNKKAITPLGWTPGDGKGISDRVHFLFTEAPGYHEHTPPHEIGRQLRFFKMAHPTKKMNDAWDAGGYYAANVAVFGGGFVTTMSMAEGFNLMDVMSVGHHWISIQEYRLLCNLPTAPWRTATNVSMGPAGAHTRLSSSMFRTLPTPLSEICSKTLGRNSCRTLN